MANCRFRLLIFACQLLWLQPWPELSFVDACVAFTFPNGYCCQRAMMNMSYLSLGLLLLNDGHIICEGLSMNGFDKDEIVRFLASFGGFGEVEDQHADLYGVLKLGNLGFQPCSHGNFLGSILGTGIVRDKIRDILLQDCGFDGCPVILLEGLSKDEFGPLNELCGEKNKGCTRTPVYYWPRRLSRLLQKERRMEMEGVTVDQDHKANLLRHELRHGMKQKAQNIWQGMNSDRNDLLIYGTCLLNISDTIEQPNANWEAMVLRYSEKRNNSKLKED
ncbi:hypothetical protein Tco_1493501 [Tanacetum coccineum]